MPAACLDAQLCTAAAMVRVGLFEFLLLQPAATSIQDHYYFREPVSYIVSASVGSTCKSTTEKCRKAIFYEMGCNFPTLPPPTQTGLRKGRKKRGGLYSFTIILIW